MPAITFSAITALIAQKMGLEILGMREFYIFELLLLNLIYKIKSSPSAATSELALQRN